MMFLLLGISCLTLLWGSVLASRPGRVLLVSMDGFRWDYLENVTTPNFDLLAKSGVKMPYMNNSFATITFPNHFTMVTGLYEESHGIVANNMFDPLFNATFSAGTTDSRWFNEGEPLWVTARKQGKITGSYFWFGSSSEIRGVRPNFWKPYNHSIPFITRVNTVIRWFKVNNADFVALYFNEPDYTGHIYGPDSQEVRDKVKQMDILLGFIRSSLQKHGLQDVNLIITSDHGMATVDTANRVVDIRDHVDMRKIAMVPSSGAVMQILPVTGEEDAVFQALSGVDHITVYHKRDIPDRFHYKNNRRIMPIVAIAEEGWLLSTNKTKTAMWKAKGNHGFDNRLMSMKPIFVASGPHFKSNYKGTGMSNVDIYPLVCKILNIQPAPNNGSLARVTGLLNNNVTFTIIG